MTADPTGETYEDVQSLIWDLTRKFNRKYGGDFEEQLGEAKIGFMKAYHGYIPSRGSFNTLLGVAIFRQLIKLGKRENRFARVSSLEYPQSVVCPSLFRFSVAKFAENLSDDAETVLNLLMATSIEPTKVSKIKLALIRGLGDMGWNFDRIENCFAEIKGAL